MDFWSLIIVSYWFFCNDWWVTVNWWKSGCADQAYWGNQALGFLGRGSFGTLWWVQEASVCWTEAEVAETGTEWALGLRPPLESSPPERWIGGQTALPVFTACAEEVGLPGIKPWALALQVTFPHLSFFQELLPMAWCWLGDTNLAACHSTDHILLSTGMGVSSRGELPMYKQQWAQSCMGTADGHAAVGACSRIPPHATVGFAVITEAITAIIAL